MLKEKFLDSKSYSRFPKNELPSEIECVVGKVVTNDSKGNPLDRPYIVTHLAITAAVDRWPEDFELPKTGDTVFLSGVHEKQITQKDGSTRFGWRCNGIKPKVLGQDAEKSKSIKPIASAVLNAVLES